MDLKDLIYQYRKQNNITQEEFARRCGVTKGYISMLESGRHPNTGNPIKVKMETAFKLAAGMGMTIDEFLCSIDNETVVETGASEAYTNFIRLAAQLSDQQLDFLTAQVRGLLLDREHRDGQ